MNSYHELEWEYAGFISIVAPRPKQRSLKVVDVIYHVTIVAIGHRFLKKCWPLVIDWALRAQVLPHPGHE